MLTVIVITFPFSQSDSQGSPSFNHQAISDQLKERLDSNRFEPSVYDEVQFNIDDEEDPIQTQSTAIQPKKPLPKIPKLKSTILPVPPSRQGKPAAKEEDTVSLDSYEEMNEVPGLSENMRHEGEPPDRLLLPNDLPPVVSPVREPSPPLDPLERPMVWG